MLSSRQTPQVKPAQGRGGVRDVARVIESAPHLLIREVLITMKIGIIGGTGLGEAFTGRITGETFEPVTPFGKPSAPIICSQWQGLPIAVLARHGQGHIYSPSHVPFRANIFALKMLGVTHIIASGAVGSLREHIQPGQLVIPDQVIDKTYRRDGSFFGNGIVAHVEFDQPFCRKLREILIQAGKTLDFKVHDRGTYVCMEGPQFSTAAESHMHRAWQGDLIGMTCMPEAKLAREAEICYALLALPTDYDCWKPHPANRPKRELLNEIIGNVKLATDRSIELIKQALHLLKDQDNWQCPDQQALELAVWTDRRHIPPAVIRELQPLIGKYFRWDNNHVTGAGGASPHS